MKLLSRATATILAVILTTAGTAVPASAGQSLPHWTVQQSPTTSDLADVSCASASECYAAGANATIIKTANGGRTWRVVPTAFGTANPTASFVSIRCPAPRVCSVLATPNIILHTTNGGQTWQEHVIGLPPQLSRLGRLACPTRSECFVTASPSGNPYTWFDHSAAIFRTGNGSKTWHRLIIPERTVCPGDCVPYNGPIGYDLQWISCQSARSCRAGGDSFIGSHEGYGQIAIGTDNGGRTWRKAGPRGPGHTVLNSFTTLPCPITAICNGSFVPNIATCPTTSICTGIFYQPLTPNNTPYLERSTNGGASWGAEGIAPILTSIACTGRTFCELAGPKGALAMAIGYKLFRQISPTTRDLTSVACPRMGACYAVGVRGTILARKK